jgi:hypothetical protein
LVAIHAHPLQGGISGCHMRLSALFYLLWL